MLSLNFLTEYRKLINIALIRLINSKRKKAFKKALKLKIQFYLINLNKIELKLKILGFINNKLIKIKRWIIFINLLLFYLSDYKKFYFLAQNVRQNLWGFFFNRKREVSNIAFHYLKEKNLIALNNLHFIKADFFLQQWRLNYRVTIFNLLLPRIKPKKIYVKYVKYFKNKKGKLKKKIMVKEIEVKSKKKKSEKK